MMARLADMYMSTPTADVSGELRALRGEESKQKQMNFDRANSLLRDVASEAQRGRYQTGLESAADVANADKVFEREYARMLSIDPQGASQMLSDYQRERGRRVNAEISQAYSGASAGDEMQSLEAELAALRDSIADEEARALRSQSDEEARALRSQYAADDMQGYVPEGARGVGRAADPAAYAAQARAEEQMDGYRLLSDYQRERGRRVNAEIAQAYSGASTGGELQSPEAELAALRSQYAADGMQGYVPEGARGVGRAADPAAYAAQARAEEQMDGYRPLQRMYRGM